MRKTSLFVVAILVLLMGCERSKPVLLPSGFYLVAPSADSSIARVSGFSDTTHVYLRDTVSLFSNADLQRLELQKSKGIICITAHLTYRGETRSHYYQYLYPKASVALVLNGQCFGKWEIPTLDYIPMMTFCNAGPVDLPQLRRLCDSLNQSCSRANKDTSKTPSEGKYITHYDKGETYEETLYRNDSVISYGKYYENGDLAYEWRRDFVKMDDFTGDEYFCEWNPGKQKWSETLESGGRFVLVRDYWANGQLRYESSNYQTPHMQPMHTREFDNAGTLIYESQTEFLPLCGEEDEFNHPQVIHVQSNRPGGIRATGDLFSSCGPECDADSCGTWHFFPENLPSFTRKFPPQEHFYRRYCSNQ